MEVVPAYRIALISGVALCGQDPQQVLPLRGVISDQQPTAGTSVWSGDSVTVSLQATTAPVERPRPTRTRPRRR
jgi:hypothetical protein